MRKIKLVAVCAAVAGLFFLGSMVSMSYAQAQTKCPVMGYKVDEKVYTDHQGKRVFFCCKDCIEKFKSDPAKYMNKMDAEQAAPAK
ncbi:MAG: YHS domain-containing protein [Syntrophobacteraceae bacterium]